VLFFGEADGDASVEAVVVVFLAVEVDFFFVVDAPWVVVAPVDVVAVDSSFFCD
jgi:hypothetical protein